MRKKEEIFNHNFNPLERRPGITRCKPIFFAIVLLLAISIACSLSGSSATDAPATDVPETDAPATESPVGTATDDLTLANITTSACEEIPNEAVVAFLYNLEVPVLVAEEQPDGIYCRFETIVVEGPAGDLGRGSAVTMLKLWFSFEDCKAAAEPAESAEVTPPPPWTYLNVLPIPNKPDLILGVTAYDGVHCVTVSAADISSQPLDHWLEFLEAIAGRL